MIYGYDNVKHKVIMARKLLGNKPYNYNIDVEDTLEKDWKGMEFDVVVGNPPYKGQSALHLKFLDKCLNLSKKYLIFIQPALWILNQKGTQKKNIEKIVLEKLKNYNFSIDLNNLASIFSYVRTSGYGMILFVDKTKKPGKIIVKNKVKNIDSVFNSISEIDQYGNSPLYLDLKEKIKKHEDKLISHIGKISGNYFVNLPEFRGGFSDKADEIMNPGSISFLPLDPKIDQEKTSKLSFSFPNEKEAKNFIIYLQTNFARFCLSINKLNISLISGELNDVPWMDFSKKWEDSDLYNFFKLSDEQIKFIEKNIPFMKYKS